MFWEIAIAGPTLELRHGSVGTTGKHELETCASEALAQNEYQLRIDAHLADGFREVADRRLDTRILDLEAAIAADPDDESLFLVYADWIQTLGDARGGLIVVQHAADSDPGAARRAAEYLKQHESLFLGPLAEHVGYDGAVLEPTWRCGFIRRAKITVRDVFGPSPARVFETFLDHPSARWLDELDIQTADQRSGLQEIADVLAVRVCPHVRALAIGEVGELRDPDLDEPAYYWERPGTDLSRVWAAVPALRRLSIRGDADRLGELALPLLSHLELEVRALSTADLDAIAGVSGPLERLELRFRWPHTITLADRLRRLFQCSLIRGLDHLAITGAPSLLVGSDGLCAEIARIPRLSLRSLDLSHGMMTDEGAEQLAASSLELDLLDVSRNRLTYRGLTALERIAKLVIT